MKNSRFIQFITVCLPVMMGLMLVMMVLFWPLNHLSSLLYLLTAGILFLAWRKIKHV